MKISPKGNVIYETLDEIINDGIDMLEESDDYYYVTSQKDPFNVYCNAHKGEHICGSEAFWKVDKKTEKVTYFGNYVQYHFGNKEKTTPVDIDKFLSERKRHSA